MQLVNIHEAKTTFSRLINQALNGEEIIIARGGKPLIRLTPYAEERLTRKGGQLKGLMEISPDFNDPLPNSVINQFYNDHDENNK